VQYTLSLQLGGILSKQERSMFTIGDIRNIAIQIERNGEETYRNASKAAKDPQVAKILAWMADEEKSHAKWFDNLRSNKPLTPEQQAIESMGRTLLQDMIKGNSFLIDEKELQNAKNVEEVVAKSITFELDTILFYEFLIDFLDDQEAIDQLKIIIEEERNHIKQLEQMEKPNNCDSSESLSCR
jgi:rubrerythrin